MQLLHGDLWEEANPDKSCSDIAVLIFASIQALLEPAGANGFILHCHNNRPMKGPPPFGGGCEIIFSYVPDF